MFVLRHHSEIQCCVTCLDAYSVPGVENNPLVNSVCVELHKEQSWIDSAYEQAPAEYNIACFWSYGEADDDPESIALWNNVSESALVRIHQHFEAKH